MIRKEKIMGIVKEKAPPGWARLGSSILRSWVRAQVNQLVILKG